MSCKLLLSLLHPASTLHHWLLTYTTCFCIFWALINKLRFYIDCYCADLHSLLCYNSLMVLYASFGVDLFFKGKWRQHGVTMLRKVCRNTNLFYLYQRKVEHQDSMMRSVKTRAQYGWATGMFATVRGKKTSVSWSVWGQKMERYSCWEGWGLVRTGLEWVRMMYWGDNTDTQMFLLRMALLFYAMIYDLWRTSDWDNKESRGRSIHLKRQGCRVVRTGS